jgi:hypothetical protein
MKRTLILYFHVTAELTYDCKSFQKVTAVTSMNGDNTKDSTPIFTVLLGEYQINCPVSIFIALFVGCFSFGDDDLTIRSTMMIGVT